MNPVKPMIRRGRMSFFMNGMPLLDGLLCNREPVRRIA
jgi:hypothetical protein